MLRDGLKNLSHPSYMTPDMEAEQVTDIDPQELQEDGIDAMILDLDQTLTHYHSSDLADELQDWYADTSERLDICILSNHASIGNQERAREVEANLDAAVIETDVKKPSQAAFDEALDYLDSSRDSTVMVGDSPICDTAGANRYGLETIQVDPLAGDDPRAIKAARWIGRAFQKLYGSLDSSDTEHVIRQPGQIDAPRIDLESLDGIETLADSSTLDAKHEIRGFYTQDLVSLKERLETNGIPAKYRWKPLPHSSHLAIEGDDVEVKCYSNRAELLFNEHPKDVARTRMYWTDEDGREFSQTDETIYGAVWQEYV
ncbi:MAG: YqeG family HAD IIIA-type phosphatase [Candidatus Nanohaloarchaea archaeon]|nr:YqeG family HAD IIIA-type phosphatase [Candidatus Nanohaloarchaea archaeon]